MAHFKFIIIPLCWSFLLLLVLGRPGQQSVEQDAANYLKEISPEIEAKYKLLFEMSFSFAGDEQDEESAIGQFIFALLVGLEAEEFFEDVNKRLKTYPLDTFENKDLARQIKLLISFSYDVLSEEERDTIQEIINKFEEIGDSVTFCSYRNKTNCDLTYNKFEWKRSLSSISDLDEIRYYWKEWRNKAGKPYRRDFKKYASLYREAAKLNGFEKASDMWFNQYEDDHILDEILSSLKDMRPLYEQMHAFARHHIRFIFGESVVSERSPIPDDLLEKFILEANKPNSKIPYPFPGKDVYDIQSDLEQKGYAIEQMIKDSEDFFKSMNMIELPSDFYRKYVQLKTNESRCFPSAVGFYTANDVGLRYCNEVSQKNYLATHREMAEIQYNLQTQNLPLAYRHINWPGFSQAVGYSVLCTVASPAHLQKVGFLKSFQLDDETNINRLYRIALQILFKMPINFVQDKFRADVLDGKIHDDDFNCEYWKLMGQYVGVKPPVKRSENDFDALANLLNYVEDLRIKKIFSKILGFQLLDGLCEKIGHTGPLHNCDFSGDNQAARALQELMSLGASKQWREVMQVIVKGDKLSGSSLLKYFEPLQNWLTENNRKLGLHVGWDDANECSSSESLEHEDILLK